MPGDSRTVWSLTPEEALAQQNSSLAGLDPGDAARRLLATGPNRLPEKPPRSAWSVLASHFTGFLNLTLIAAALIAAAIGDMKTAVVVAVVIIFNATLGYRQEHRAERALAALERMVALSARVRRGERIVQVPADALVPGDVVLLEVGERIPADGRLLSSLDLQIDESSLTGESNPAAKRVDLSLPRETPLADRRNMAYMNAVVTRGRGEMLVSATGAATEIGRIAGLLDTGEAAPTPLQIQLDHLGKRIALIAAGIIAIITVFGFLRGHSLARLAIEAVALGVSAVPEGLPAVVTVTLALGIQRMAKQRAILKRLGSVETLGCTTVICSDKTGTLTLNEMTASAFWMANRRFSVAGAGYGPEGAITAEGATVRATAAELSALLIPIALCNESHVRDGVLIGDPTEGALMTLAKKAGLDVGAARASLPRIAEVPFDSERKFMATFHRDGELIRVLVKGGPGVVLDRCGLVSDASHALDAERKAFLLAENLALAGRGLRVLAVASGEIPVSGFDPKGNLADQVKDLTFVGLVGLSDPARPEAREAIAECKRAGISVKMMTGDQPVTAAAIARDLGLEGTAVTGAELDTMDDAALAAVLPGVAVFARLAPEHKLRLVQALKAQGHVVAMTGDGVNDAPALKSADIGIAMGSGSEVAKEAATMVLTDDNFATIVGAVREGRTIYGNILKFVRFQLSTNAGALLTVFAAPFFGLPPPLGPIQILWVNMIADGPPALALSLDPAHPSIMSDPPRDPRDRILDWRRLARLLFSGAVMAVGTLALLHVASSSGDAKAAATLSFTTFVLFQVVNALNARAAERSVFTPHVFTNLRLWLALAAVVGMQAAVVHWGPAQQLFGTVALAPGQWLLSAAVAAGLMAVEELRKLLSRRLAKRAPAASSPPSSARNPV